MLLYGGIVQVVNNWLSINARRGQLQGSLAQERSVVTCCIVALSEHDFTASAVESMEFGGLHNGLQHARVLVALSKGVINVNVLSCVLKLLEELVANSGWVLLLGAFVILKTFIGRGSKDAIPVSHFDVLVLIVEVVVSNTVSDNKAFEVGNIAALATLCAISDVPIKSFNKTRNINASI